MKTLIHKFNIISLVIMLLVSSPMFLAAQQKFLGNLTITANTAEGFVTVNGERAADGGSISSPSAILTSPQASAKIAFDQTGNISISPNSKLNLLFNNASISVEITSGEITVQTVPNTSFTLFAPDGNLTLPVESQENIVKVEVVNGKTTVRTLVGNAIFNNTLVSAGEFYPSSSGRRESGSSTKSKGFNPLLLIALLGGGAAIALVALSSSSDSGGSSPVSPVR